MSEIDSGLKQHSLALTEKIQQRINQEKHISFADFMQMALYQPGLGYYSSGTHKFGKNGDFITSPELGGLFAQCMAEQFKQVLNEVSDPTILELGAGTGQFCFDCLLALDQLSCAPEIYYILEISADLQLRQRKLISILPIHLRNKVIWIKQPPEQKFNGVLFANEVLDALPVEIFKYQDSAFKQLTIGYQGEFMKTWADFSADLHHQILEKQLQLSNGYESEFIPHLSRWLQTISDPLKQGCVIFVDYGYERSSYYHPQRNQGTLVCHFQHRANFDYLKRIGIQDITAFVDFTAVAEAADCCGLSVDGYTTQAHFLMGLGIHEKLGDSEVNYQQYYQKSTEMKKLTLPNEMGEKFKVMALSRDFDKELKGFSFSNPLHLL